MRARPAADGRVAALALQRVDEFSAGGLVVDLAERDTAGRAHRAHRPPGSAALVSAEGARRAGRDPEQAAVREVAEETGIAGEILGESRHDRLLVHRGGTAGAQDRPALPAAGRRRRTVRRRHRGHQGRMGAVPADLPTGSPTRTSEAWLTPRGDYSRTPRESTTANRATSASGRAATRKTGLRRIPPRRVRAGLTPTSAGAAPPLTESSVTVRVVDMSPTTATGTAKPAPLTITVALTNTTGQELRDVQLSAQREAPISQPVPAGPADGAPDRR